MDLVEFEKEVKRDLSKKVIILLIVGIMCVCMCYIRIPNINSCSMSDLTKIDGIGKVTAERIVKERPFQDWGEVERKIEGLGKVKVKKLKWRMKLK